MFNGKQVYLLLQVLASISFSLMDVHAADLSEFQILQLCDGKYMNIIAYPGEPSKFIVCLNENTQVGICHLEKDVQTCFNEHKQTCSLDYCVASRPPSDYDNFIVSHCKNDNNMFTKMPADNCESFYICLGSRTDAIREDCPDGQHYSKVMRTCMNPMEANCQTLDSMCTKQKTGYRFQGTTCYDYYECDRSKPIAKSCSYGLHFDNVTKKCIPDIDSQCIDKTNRIPKCTASSNGEYFKHFQCNRFYICLNTVALEGQCPQGYYFDASAQLCKKDTKGICSE